jgi:hypothetical protein
LADVLKFLGFAFIVPQSVIEKVSLPLDPRDLGGNPFKIADQI